MARPMFSRLCSRGGSRDRQRAVEVLVLDVDHDQCAVGHLAAPSVGHRTLRRVVAVLQVVRERGRGGVGVVALERVDERLVLGDTSFM